MGVTKMCQYTIGMESFKNIISNDRSFCCPMIYIDIIYNAILFIDISTMCDTTELIL